MKKLLLLSLLITISFGAIKSDQKQIKTIKISKQEKQSYINRFKKEPVKFIFSIYDDYHFNRVDEGIKKALSVLEYLNTKDNNEEINSPFLRWKKVYQIKSTLHTLLGLLYIKKSGQFDKVEREKERKYILETLKKKGKLSKEDLDYLFKMSQQRNDEYEKYMKFYINEAIKSFNKAIKEFPDNPYPYIQLANFYKNSGDEREAQKYLEKAVKLFLKYNQVDMYQSLLKQAKEDGYDPKFIKKLEGLLK